jgi:hypothetical protein
MAEVGMMMILRKHFLLLRQRTDAGQHRRRGDSPTIPFDVGQLPIHFYEVGSEAEDLQIFLPGGTSQRFNDVLDNFIGQLPSETGFPSAQPWIPLIQPL